MGDQMTDQVIPATPDVPVAETPKVETPKEEMRTFKVNGKDVQVPVSKIDERVMKSFGAEEAMKKAAMLENAFSQFVAKSQDPVQLLELLQSPAIKYDDVKQEALAKAMLNSKNPRIINAVKQWIYENEIEPSLMDPKERELKELKSWKEDQLKKKEKEDLDLKQKQEEEAVKAAWNDYRTKIGQELTTGGIPVKESNVARVARYALLYSKAGKPVDLKDCVARVKADLIAEYKELYKDYTEDNILDGMDEETAQKINKALLKKLNAKAKDAPKKKEKENTPEQNKQFWRDLQRGIVR